MQKFEFKIVFKEDNMAAAADRKSHYQGIDMDRKENDELNDLEEEARKENEYLIEKAKQSRIEQEDEVKRLNELIINAKVKYPFKGCSSLKKIKIGVFSGKLAE